jgi:hypothetical protein
MSQQPPRSRNNLSLFVGLWLGLTLVAGLSVFALVYWMTAPQSPTPAPTVPVAASQTTVNIPTVAPATPTPEGVAGGGPACSWLELPASGFGYGIQSHVFGGGDNAFWMTMVRDKLHFHWVKIQVRWKDLETAPGQIFWDVLDSGVNEACNNGLRVMLSVVAAPDWTRANPLPAPEGQEAPPDDYQTYANFLAAILDRYPGKIGAIEVWNEMNLEREWNTAAGISPVEYTKMLALAYNTIKSKDPGVVVIAGALSPTGINCAGSWPECGGGRPVVMDDATYLTQFVQAGGLQYADCIGAHSNGTNLPPTADALNPPGTAEGKAFTGPWNNPHYSWSLKSQVDKYASILGGQKQQCVTEFGYASAVNGQYPAGYEFAADVSEQQQAEYLVEAFNWMRASGQVKLAFLFNLNYGPLGGDPASDDNVVFSILAKEGFGRPAFDALGAMNKP